MAVGEKCGELFRRLQFALDSAAFPNFIFRPKQIQCLEFILSGIDVVAVLPTGFGKSVLFQILPFFLPLKVKEKSNIVLVVSPLNSIITDQISVLKKWGIRANVLTEKKAQTCSFPQLFSKRSFTTDVEEETCSEQLLHLPSSVRNGETHIVFCHPEAILGLEGRLLLKTPAYQKQVVACVIDEAHCVEMWYVYIYILS